MKKQTTKYTDHNLKIGKAVKDNFLPSPNELKKSDEKVKVTLSITKRSKKVLESQAKKHGLKYQYMIREIIDSYAQNVLRDKAQEKVHKS